MKPSIYKIAPFDATVGATVTFSWTGRQQKENVIKITNNATGTVVYESEPYASYTGVNVIPAMPTYSTTGVYDAGQYCIYNEILYKCIQDIDVPGAFDPTKWSSTGKAGLRNAQTYLAKIQVTDMDDTDSEWSTEVSFKCFSTPTFIFSDISTDPDNPTRVTGSNKSLELSYSTSASESTNALNVWKMYLYSQSKIEITSSPETYAASSMAYTFSGLDDTTVYYIRAVGTTTTGMAVDTGYVKIYVNYSNPSRFVNFRLVNNANEGTVTIQSFAVAIRGDSVSPVEYLPETAGGTDYYAADLTDGNIVTFNYGFALSKEFTGYLKFQNPTLFKNIAVLKTLDSDLKLELKWWKTTLDATDTVKYHIYMVGNNDGNKFSMISNSITAPSTLDWLELMIYRDGNGFYTLKLINMGH